MLMDRKGRASARVYFKMIRDFLPKELYNFLILVNVITKTMLL